MSNRRLVTAAAVSLGFHAVLLTVVGMGISDAEERPDYPLTQVRLSAAVESTPAVAGIVSESDPEPEDVKDEPVDTVPASELAHKPIQKPEPAKPVESTLESAQRLTETSADSGNAGVSGETAASPIIEDSRPSLITTIDPVYPIQARRLGVEGVVDLVVTVDSTGLPVECIVIPPRVHKVLEKSALAAVMQARFKPGMENGRPIQDTYRLKVRFELEA